MDPLLLSIDVGTTSFKCVFVDENGQTRGEFNRPQTSPAKVSDWFAHLQSIVRESGFAASIQAIVVSGQMHGTQLIGTSGEFLGPCLLWNDHRNASKLPELLDRVGDRLPLRIGSTIVSGYQALNLFCHKDWESVQHVLLPKDAFVYALTGEAVTEPSDAAGTGLFDGQTRTWATDIADALEIPERVLPNIVQTGSVVGTLTASAAAALGMRPDTKVMIGGGDTPMAVFGADIGAPDQTLIMLSTSAQVIQPVADWNPDPEARWYTWPSALTGTDASWLKLATLTNGGSTLAWLQSVAPTALSSNLNPVPVLFVPHLQGQRFPKPDAKASGAFLGLRSNHTASDLALAVMQGLAFQFKRADSIMQTNDAPTQRTVYLGGGASRTPGFARVLANVLEHPIQHMQDSDLTIMGGARLAAGTLGWTPPAAPESVRVEPDLRHVATYRDLYDVWCEADELVSPLSQRLHQISAGGT